MTIDLDHIETWIFDLDNTLYCPSVNLFAQIDVRMGAFIARLLDCDLAEARRIQKSFFHTHGTTLRGLMNEHDVDPSTFLNFVHDVDFGALSPTPEIAAKIRALPGRKLIFTNGDLAYAEKVLEALDLLGIFEAVHDIHAMNYRPKPDAAAYTAMCNAHGIDPRRALFAEDMARNLPPAKALGMTTVWLDNGAESGTFDVDHDAIDIVAGNLESWLDGLEITRNAA